MNIIIIGAKGFIGSHLFRFFSEQYKEVYGYDKLPDPNCINYYSHEIISLEEVFVRHKFDMCINAAGAASVPMSIENPELDRSLNVDLVDQLLKLIQTYSPACKFVNLSSAAVYGNPIVLPIDEGHPVNPLSPYGEHKLQAENLCSTYYKKYNIPTVSVRIFSAFGAGLKKQLFWDLYQKSLSGRDIELFGTGNESRDFVYIDDLAHAIKCILQNARFNGQVINLANGIEIKISVAAQLFLSMLDFKGKLTFTNAQRKGDPSNWVADVAKLKSLGYKQQISFEQGLKQYIKWLKSEEK